MGRNFYKQDDALNVMLSARGGVNVDATGSTQTLIAGVAGTDTATTRYFPYEDGFHAIYSQATSLISLGAASTGRGEELATNGTFLSDTVWTKGTGWVIGAADLVTNGVFSADTDWTKTDGTPSGWSIAGNVASCDGSQTVTSDIEQSISVTNGLSYRVSFSVSGFSAGTLTPYVGGTAGTPVGADGDFDETIVAGAGGAPELEFRADTAFIGDLDNVIVREVGVAGLAASDGSQSADSDLSQAGTIVPGSSYEVIFTVSNRTAGNVTAVVGGTEGTDRATDATFTETIVAGSDTPNIVIRADLDFVGEVDTVSVTEVVSNTMLSGTPGEAMEGIELTGTVALGGLHTVLVITAGTGRVYFG